MTYKTHLIGGATIGLAIAQLYPGTVMDTSLLIGTSMLGSVLPDIDHNRSKLAQGDAVVGIAATAVSKFTKHRGFTHTIPVR